MLCQHNVLISDEGEALLCDFGLAFLNDDAGPGRGVSYSLRRAGSKPWMAIELQMEDDPGVRTTVYSDMWAYGMVVIEVRQILLYKDSHSINITIAATERGVPVSWV